MESVSDSLGLKRKAVPASRIVVLGRVTYQSAGTRWQLRVFGRNKHGLLISRPQDIDLFGSLSIADPNVQPDGIRAEHYSQASEM